MQKLGLIALGGGVGALLRFGMASWLQRWSATPFPAGTLVVNLVGCLLIGFCAALFAGPFLVREEYRLAILVGLLGGFTTFSTYGAETVTLLEDGSFRLALTNVLASNVLGLAAVWIGLRVGSRWPG